MKTLPLLLSLPLLAPAAPSVDVLWTKTICAEGKRAVGWPSVARLKSGAILAVFSGNRRGHICPDGVVQVVRSDDDGETWSAPLTIGDTPVDDRDAGICQLPNGEVLVTWFTSIAYYTHPYFRKMYGKAEKRPLEELVKEVDYYCVRSRDDGRTWTKPERIPTLKGSSPHGPIVAKRGHLLHVGRTPAWRDAAEKGFGDAPTFIACEASRDGGRTWKTLCEKIPAADGEEGKNNWYHEPHVAELPNGRLVALVRTPAPDRCFRRSESRDGGKTWTKLARTSLNAGGTPPYLTALKDGRLVCVYGVRNGDAGIGEFVAVSSDAGLTWTKTEALPLHRAAPGVWSGDLGYPATAVMKDGSFLTVYYEPESKGSPSVLMATRWRLR